MRFRREGFKPGPRGITPRRLAAAKRALQRQREKLPLFADEIARSQPTPEERIRKHDETWERHKKSIRSFVANQWCEGRRKLRAMPKAEQKKLLDYWNNHKFLPASSEYFADLVTNWERVKVHNLLS